MISVRFIPGPEWKVEVRHRGRVVLRVTSDGLARFLVALGVVLVLLGLAIATFAPVLHPGPGPAPAPATRGDGNVTYPRPAPVLLVSPQLLGTYDALVVTVIPLEEDFTSNATVVRKVPDRIVVEVSMDRMGLLQRTDLGVVNDTRAIPYNTSLDWEWGEGTVTASFERMNVTLQLRFTLVFSDLARYQLDARRRAEDRAADLAEQEAFYGLWRSVFGVLIFALLLGGFLVIGYTTHRYHEDRGEESWWTVLTRWGNVSLERNPMKQILDTMGSEDRPRKEVLALLKSLQLAEEMKDLETYDVGKLKELHRRIAAAIEDLDRVTRKGRAQLVVASKQVRIKTRQEQLLKRGVRVRRLKTELKRLRESIEEDLAELDKEI